MDSCLPFACYGGERITENDGGAAHKEAPQLSTLFGEYQCVERAGNLSLRTVYAACCRATLSIVAAFRQVLFSYSKSAYVGTLFL